MFDIGFTELVLIGIVALVVIGPERLPAVARTAGQWIAKLQRFVKGVKTDLASELDSGDLKKLIGDQREQIDELRSLVSSASKDFHNSTSDVMKSAKKRMNELETSIKDEESLPVGETKILVETDVTDPAWAGDHAPAESPDIGDATANANLDSAINNAASKASTPTAKAQSEATVDSVPDDSSAAESTSAQEDHSTNTKPTAGSSDMGRAGS